ncbi:MAG: hypothetical protein PGN29_18730, partial [Gordonia paraffinivorans]
MSAIATRVGTSGNDSAVSDIADSARAVRGCQDPPTTSTTSSPGGPQCRAGRVGRHGHPEELLLTPHPGAAPEDRIPQDEGVEVVDLPRRGGGEERARAQTDQRDAI